VDTSLLPLLERYYDTAPRATARTEDLGPLTLFVAERGWPYYARPRLGLQDVVRREEVEAVLDRQTALSVPRSLEWVHETTPSLEQAARDAGMSVARCPLMVLDTLTAPAAPAGRVRIVDADDPDLAAVRAAIHVAFGAAGTARGPQSVAERDAAAAAAVSSTSLDTTREAIRAGRSVQVGAFDDTDGPVGGGSHNPRGDVSEIVGVAVLPAHRRRGLAAAVTALLATDAAERGVRTVFCSAESADVARIYESLGFRRVGTACIAETD
jgi:ribosomal protein S18 acetylase RimI-like enzyme